MKVQDAIRLKLQNDQRTSMSEIPPQWQFPELPLINQLAISWHRPEMCHSLSRPSGLAYDILSI